MSLWLFGERKRKIGCQCQVGGGACGKEKREQLKARVREVWEKRLAISYLVVSEREDGGMTGCKDEGVG